MRKDILIHVDNGVGVITLNRPEALNALNVSMIMQIHTALKVWEMSPSIKAVILKANGKAFCAGGDIVAIQQASIADQTYVKENFFSREYALNHAISTFSKPYVSLINGYCMGGGMGLSIHGQYRVVSEKAIMAMPETAIGFFPDVGGSYFLSRLPGRLGMYLGLTGAKISAADAMYCGLATHQVSSDSLEDLESALIANPEQIAETLANFAQPMTVSELEANRNAIDLYFASDVPEENIAAMEAKPSHEADQFLKAMRRISPHAARQTAALVTAATNDDLRTCLDRELEATRGATIHPDFIEGIRAALVDKDHDPKWADTSLAA